MNEYRDRVILPSLTKTYGRYIGMCVKVLDMTGLNLSALNQIKLLTVVSTIDDLNYLEKTETYYVVNVPYIFSACWKVVKPLLQERPRRKIQVLSGCGRDELLKIMDYASLRHFCEKWGSGSGSRSRSGSSKCARDGIIDNCFSLDHEFHRQLYNYSKLASFPAGLNFSDKTGLCTCQFSEARHGRCQDCLDNRDGSAQVRCSKQTP